jgi:glucose-1-phosphate adenylyltransferase
MIDGGGLARGTVAVILAGGEGTRLGPLTRHVCKPALPFGAAYRNIDFSLSNCVNSDIRRIGVATQHKAELLLQHLDGVWSKVARRSGEFINAWPADTRSPVEGYRGTADAVFRNLDLIEREHHRLVLVLAGDHVYKMDYRPMLEFHRLRQADVTVGCIDVPVEEASQFGVVSIGRGGRIDRFVEKPKSRDELPGGDRVSASMGIYVFDAPFLARVLRRDALSDRSQYDFGGDILPSLLRDSAVYAYPFLADGGNEAAYWRDVGTPAAYWRAHLDLLDDSPRLSLDDAGWPLPSAAAKPRLTLRHARSGAERSPSKSLVADGCEIAGVVNQSVLFSGVRVSRGSAVARSVVLPGAVIGRNCRLSGTIIDSECRIPDGTVIDSSWRTDKAGRHEPVIVTAEDFAHDSIYSYA